MTPSPNDLFKALEETWPPALVTQKGKYRVFSGEGGGKRVSATRVFEDLQEDETAEFEELLKNDADSQLFQLTPDQVIADKILQDRGYQIVDPTVLMSSSINDLHLPDVPPVTTFLGWPELQVQREVWAEGGIGSPRIAVMHRVHGPKITVLGRINDRVMGTCFAAISDGIAMVHALEIRDAARRQRLGTYMMAAASHWAAESHGAAYLAIATTEANAAAQALYEKIGMHKTCRYHYRVRPNA